MIDYVKGSSSVHEPQQINNVSSFEIPIESKHSQSVDEEPIAHVEILRVASSSTKLEPFYVLLFIHGYKMNNCIIDSHASDNIMLAYVAKDLDIPLTKTFGNCYAMDAKHVPLVG